MLMLLLGECEWLCWLAGVELRGRGWQSTTHLYTLTLQRKLRCLTRDWVAIACHCYVPTDQ
jgi:hypothetical protein